jgi:hypothetical protein
VLANLALGKQRAGYSEEKSQGIRDHEGHGKKKNLTQREELVLPPST